MNIENVLTPKYIQQHKISWESNMNKSLRALICEVLPIQRHREQCLKLPPNTRLPSDTKVPCAKLEEMFHTCHVHIMIYHDVKYKVYHEIWHKTYTDLQRHYDMFDTNQTSKV